MRQFRAEFLAAGTLIAAVALIAGSPSLSPHGAHAEASEPLHSAVSIEVTPSAPEWARADLKPRIDLSGTPAWNMARDSCADIVDDHDWILKGKYGLARQISPIHPDAPVAMQPAAPQSSDDPESVGSPLLKGIDVSSYTQYVQPGTWIRLKADGWGCVVVAAWQGRHENPYAQVQLQGAREAGMKTAAYCLMNFDQAADTGDKQVAQALDAVKSEPVAFMALDIEVPGPGFHFKVNAVQRIAQAVRAITAAGLKPVIYTKQMDWKRITRDSKHPHGTSAFKSIPLWGLRWDDLEDMTTDGVDPWRQFGGWTSRSGKQYSDNRGFGAQSVEIYYDIKSVDLNIFAAGLFDRMTVARVETPHANATGAHQASITLDPPPFCL